MGKRTKQRYARAAANAPTWLRTGVIAKRDGRIAHANYKTRKMGKLGPASECRTLTAEEIASLEAKSPGC